MTTKITIETAEAFDPLWDATDADFLVAHGGRGSGKSHDRAAALLDRCQSGGQRWACLREVQKDLKDSAKLLLEDKIEALGFVGFQSQRDQILCPGGGQIIFRGMTDYNAESIKSLEGFNGIWIEEGQVFSARSWRILRPTLFRVPGAQIWVTMNRRNPADPLDQFFFGDEPIPGAVIVHANYNDNPWFPDGLERQRLLDQRMDPDRYAHTWLGEHEPVAIGAIWTRQVIADQRRTEAPDLERIVVSVDPAISAETGADEHGIIACARGADNRGYMLDDASMRGSPRQWADRAIALYDRLDADAIVIERNQGGDMCRHTLQAARPGVRIVEVTATRGKHVRAEPISALYSMGRISHVGTFRTLEDQMCQMTAAGYEGQGSPDRCDAMVWAFTELFPQMIRPKTKTVRHVEPYGVGGWMG